MTNSDFYKEVKSFMRMPQDVTIYDDEIHGLTDEALATLEVAGVGLEKSRLVVAFVRTYVRVRMLQDASDAFRKSELEREKSILRQLTYGGL